jgi:hypothetical protein
MKKPPAEPHPKEFRDESLGGIWHNMTRWLLSQPVRCGASITES